MKKLSAISVFIIFSVHSIFCGFFDGKWSTLSSPYIETGWYGQISGKGEYLWFKADNSVMRFNVKTNELRSFDYDFSRLDLEEAVFFPLDSGHIALTSSRGICIFNGRVWTFFTAPYELGASAIDTSGTIWSIFRINNSEGPYDKVYYFKNSQWFEAPFNNQITGTINLINADINERIWFTGPSRIFCYDKVTDSLSIFPSDNMKYTTQDQPGNVWFYNDTSLYSTSDSGLIHRYRNNNTFSQNSLQIDSNGDLWFVSKDDRKKIEKVDLSSSQTIWRFTTPNLVSALHSSTYGVFTFSNSGLFHFKNNDTIASNIVIDSLICSSCPNVRFSGPDFSLFRKNGSHLYTTDDLFSKEILVERVDDQCSIIPLPFECHITSMFERSDGALIAGLCGENCGLYSLNGGTWTLFPGTDGIRINKLFEDSKSKIWGLFGDKIIRQTQTGWELIDTSNSDLPQPIRNTGFGHAFVEDSEHAVWTVFDSSVARTFDGYNWTTYTLHNFNSHVYSNQIFFYKDQRNNVQLLWCDTVGSSLFVIRATFKENQWQYEKISFPGEISAYPALYQDCRGIIYLTPFRGDTLFYYNSTASKWIILDKSATPYNLKCIISDDNHGKLYFHDRSDQIIVFEYSNTIVKKQNLKTTRQEGMKTNVISSGKLTLEYTLSKPDKVSIRVFSADGRMVKQLFNGFHRQGTFAGVYDLRLSKGMYIVQLQTTNMSIEKRTIVR
ncbi:MAG TPA: T9SS type A sorting domain-containing protein [Chitinispirillaceae bacterium]|nr:T9SS type A sorting domain-containing protein [Chitinispirillaceae bacterium]